MSGQDHSTYPTPEDRYWARFTLEKTTGHMPEDERLRYGRAMAVGVSEAALARASAESDADAGLIRRARAFNELLWEER